MRLVEQHVIAPTDQRYRLIDAAAFASKNLWNAANYLVRQSFIKEGTYLNNKAVYHLIKGHAAYQALPRKVSESGLDPAAPGVGGLLRGYAGLARAPRTVRPSA